MRKHLLSFFIAITLLSINYLAYADQLIIQPDMGCKPILNAIQSTEHTVKLVMYGFTETELLDKIIQQKHHGRTVKVILEKSPYKAPNENYKTINKLEKNHIDWVGSVPPFALIHQKTLLIDDKKAVIMTFNFTRSSFLKNSKKARNFGLILTDPLDVREIARYFSADWNHKPITSQSPHLIWSPDDSREKIIGLIKNARQSIQIYAQSFSDHPIVNELAKASRRGVNVSILTSNKPREKIVAHLERAGVHIRHDDDYYIHAKVMIIDHKRAMLGSINLTPQSLDRNRELAVITEDANAVKELTRVFNSDWDSSSSSSH